MGIIVTACTKRKAGDPQVLISDIPADGMAMVGGQWVAALRSADTLTPAVKLYQGASHAEGRRAALGSGYCHFIVSAGLGLISAEASVPNYAASVLSGADDILSRFSDGKKADAWWCWLQNHSPFARSLRDVMAETDGPCLIALPQAYLAMIQQDLLALPSGALERVRLFSGTQAHPVLAHLQMPYDDRLDGPDSPHKGTRSNFAPRAMRHFALNILPGRETESAWHQAAAVHAALADWHRPSRTFGQRKTDAELRKILKAHWDAVGGRSTRLLRVLRDDLGIACEQGRFAGLVRDLRAEQRTEA